MPGAGGLPLPVSSVPVEPGSDEARRLLEQELARPGYPHPSLLDIVLRWFDDLFSGAPGAPSGIGLVVLVAVLLLLLALLVWKLWDLRSVVQERRRRAGGLTDPTRSAVDYLAEARAHLDQGAHDRAVVAGFRALVVGLDDRDVVHDAPGRTAQEVGRAAAHALPSYAERARRCALVFDAACYGHPDGPVPGADEPQRTTAQDAADTLALASELQGAR
ncbi:DUF4129 domain-containing protein [Arsenicicoccus sp. oral taxon 190]|uniref:DUF4129 domain-containing protein n=1 Tax=Arsenicicoccus sp. oral taxon 190 TaxID=1658671 RepID=UPI00067AE8D7|nr:DUF4129 domain-containing protein [Arsenicicoccus sp. oral taxon 190]